MPKKTKREKMLAEKHRNYGPYRSPSEKNLPATSTLPLPASPIYTFQQHQQPASMKTTTTSEFREIRIDMIKTLILAGLIIAAEFGLYWNITK